ncbi:helix-turn-helix domain-containing protein [Polaribacter sp. L3A8]|uniref:helix-turn-helix domain-containing protein n=1 Tax=Polaribacter sp. L3A8 TaxID=2686361 RepID=UPI00131DF1FB|nr:AraC family transcriptional regulator [Polaribacter sp. L3A8]
MKYFPTIITVFLIIYSINTCSQTQDSINSLNFEELTEKYYEYKFTDSLKAKRIIKIFLKKSKKQKDTIKTIQGYNFLSDIFNDDNIYLNHLDSLIEKTKKKPNKLFPAYLYSRKGRYYLYNSKINKSLKNYISAIKLTNIYRNDSLKYIFKQKIGILKYRNKNFNESKKINLETYNFYKKKPQFINLHEYYNLLSNISANYLKEKKYDSAIYFNNKSSKYALKNNFLFFIPFFKYRKGKIELDQKKYLLAINSFKESIPGIIDDENYYILSESYNYIAESYSKLGNLDAALKYNFLIDSLYSKTKITQKSQRNAYQFLINHYKEKKDLKNQLKYIEKFLKIDSILNSREKNLSKTFSEKYDKKRLIAEKEKIIYKLKNDISTFQKSKNYFLVILFIVIILFLYQYNKRKIQKKSFDKIITDLKNKKTTILNEGESKIESNNISKEIINDILSKLHSFEKSKGYTNSDITLSKLAKELNTNSNYLSKIINQNKGVNFSTYINKLRINYTLLLLEENEVIRKYTIAAIANEVGFKNAESFSKAFFKETKLKPSFYIKELENQKVA